MKSLFFFILFLLVVNTKLYCQNSTKQYFISTYIGTIQYYGDLNEQESNLDIRHYFEMKDPLFGFCIGKNLNPYFNTQLTLEGGNFKAFKNSVNIGTTTSFYQISQRIEMDLFNLTHRGIPVEKQRFNNYLYVGVGLNGFKSYANELDGNRSLRRADDTKFVLSYGIVFKFKLNANTALKLDFGHNKVYSDIFDATIDGSNYDLGQVKDKKLSSNKTALDLWAGLRVGVIFNLEKKSNSFRYKTLK